MYWISGRGLAHFSYFPDVVYSRNGNMVSILIEMK